MPAATGGAAGSSYVTRPPHAPSALLESVPRVGRLDQSRVQTGHAEILDHGDLVDEMRQKLAAVGEKWQLPPVTTVIRVTVDSVVDLWPGPHAGEEEVLAGAAGDWKTYD